jgi:hypothetical protein
LGDRALVGEPGMLSPEDRDRLRDARLLLGVRGEPSCSARLLLSLRSRDGFLFLSSRFWVFFFVLLLAILPPFGGFFRPPILMEVESMGTARIVTLLPPASIRDTTWT